MLMSKLTELIAPSFYEVHNAIKNEEYTHYLLNGGRGSTKSSFIGIEIPLGIMKNRDANAVVIRKVGLYLKDSVFEQLVWGIEKLGVSELWKIKLSPLELVYIPTGQRILFRGADKPKKLKSTKVSQGYIRYIWYEEVDEFAGMDEIRTINQSLMRGGSKFDVFYSYNPPKSQRNWINAEAQIIRADRLVHHSTYLTVPKEWLGEQFIIEAEHLKEVSPNSYKHEYLGEAVGTGGEVFTNIVTREITEDDISSFDRIRQGIDFGYASDPFVYIVCHYDKKYKRLYIFDEIYAVGLSNKKAAEGIIERKISSSYIICDSAEPKSINELKSYNLRVKGAKKGPDSVEYGIKFLQSLEQIIIDPVRCPNTHEEFYKYELEPDGNGGFKAFYPDKNNHTIDAVRYALENDMKSNNVRVGNRRELGI